MRKLNLKKTALLVLTTVIVALGLLIYALMGPFRTFFWNMPYIMGFFGTHTTLILLQNNYELRPAGGFISAYALVSSSFGSTSIQVADSYAIPSPSPKISAPYPFEKLIGATDPFYEGYTFRDANFSPDFPTSAKNVLQFFSLAYPDQKVDMVVSIDMRAIEQLIKLYEPLLIEGNSVTSENFFILTQKLSKTIDIHNEEQLTSRKNILSPLMQTLISKAKSPFGLSTLLSTLKTQLDQKHIQTYTLSALQKKFTRLGWSGELSYPSGSDLLHVNIANIGGRKADRYVQKKIDYTVTLREGKPALARAIIDITHNGDYNIQSDIYQAYIRTYVPLGSELTEPSPTGLEPTAITTELHATVFSDMIKLLPSETIRLTYTYILPETITPQNYALSIPKQAGTTDTLLTVTIRTPNDTALISSPPSRGDGNTNKSLSCQGEGAPLCGAGEVNREPEGSSSAQSNQLTNLENVSTFTGKMETDLHFQTRFIPDAQPPLIIWQEFAGLSTVNVRFHEEIDPRSIEDLNKFLITDTNYANQSKDEITITNATFKDRDLWLTVSGVTRAPLERYRLFISNITDLAGNKMEPSPTELTLVQR